MKKLLSLTLAATLCLGLTACAGNSGDTTTGGINGAAGSGMSNSAQDQQNQATDNNGTAGTAKDNNGSLGQDLGKAVDDAVDDVKDGVDKMTGQGSKNN